MREISCFEDIAQEWMSLKKCKAKESTIQRYDSLIQRYLYPYFKMKTEEMNTQSVNGRLVALYEDYTNNLAYGTIKTLVFLVKTIFRYGMTAGYLQKINFIFELPPKANKTEIPSLNLFQEKQLVERMLKDQTPNHLGVLIALNTGLRVGEVCSLKMKDINLEDQTISVNRTVQRLKAMDGRGTSLVISTPKSSRSMRKIPLTGFLNKVLLSYPLEWGQKDFFLLSGDNTPYEPRTLQYAFSKECELSCGEKMHFHCLRHTFATRCVQAGFDLKTLSEILGHTSVNFTMNRYVHSDMERKREQMKLIDRSWI